ncbi:hypothetical protein LINPERHAP1_LOCUS12093 [Linum perenne]
MNTKKLLMPLYSLELHSSLNIGRVASSLGTLITVVYYRVSVLIKTICELTYSAS